MNKYAENPGIQTAVKIFSAVTAAAAGCAGILFYGAEIKTLLVLFAFLLFWVLIPGFQMLDSLKMSDLRISTYLSRGFFLGFFLNVILYYLSALAGTNLLMYIAGPVVSILWLARKFRGGASGAGKTAIRLIRRSPASFWFFAACVFIASITVTQFIYVSPEHSAYSAIKLDFGYHAGIINALSQGYPPADPWISGLTIQYHFFSEMLLSIPQDLFGLPSEQMLMSGTPYLITPVLTVSLYSFFREFSGRKERAGLYCLAFHFSNMFILKEFADSWFLYHIYSNINNAGLGIACLLTALPLLRTWDGDRLREEGRSGGSELFVLGALIMLMTGIKGPIALILVGGMIGTALLGLILRKINVKTAGAVVLAAICFVLIYVFVLGSQHENTTGATIFNIGEVTDLFFLKEEIMGALGSISRVAGLLVLFAVFGIFYLTAFLVPFIAGYVRELFLVLTGRKDFSFSRVTVYACALVGFLGMMLLDFSGHSQVYFGFAASVLVPMIAFWFLEEMSEDHSAGMRFVRGFFIVCLCLSACTSLLYTFRSIDNARDYYLSHDENSNKYRNVTPEEYEGLIWIRDNTKEDDLIASDRYYSVSLSKYDCASRGDNTHFAYAIYSQRRQYLEGSGFSLSESLDDIELRSEMIDNNNALYDPENKDRGKLAGELDVDYVIVSKRFDDVGDLSGSGYELCFSNDDMDIYKVK